VVRTRTVISQAHSFQWLGSFGNRGNGRATKGTSTISRKSATNCDKLAE
jgi:hypothetical protein